MTAVLLALGAALCWGSSDYVAGRTARTSSGTAVVVGAHLMGLAVLLPCLVLVGGVATTGDLRWGALAGLGGAVGASLLYRGLAIGRMSVVAPMTALLAAALPVTTGLVGGDAASPLAVAGLAVTVVAITFLSAGPAEASGSVWWRQPGLVEAIGGGVAFGLFFVALDQTSDTAGLWPLLSARMASVNVLGVLVFGGAVLAGTHRREVLAGPGSLAAVGVLDVGAAALYLFASRQGLLSVVAVLASLYPAATVVLARTIDRERCGRHQVAGLALALLGVSALTLG